MLSMLKGHSGKKWSCVENGMHFPVFFGHTSTHQRTTSHYTRTDQAAFPGPLGRHCHLCVFSDLLLDPACCLLVELVPDASVYGQKLDVGSEVCPTLADGKHWRSFVCS